MTMKETALYTAFADSAISVALALAIGLALYLVISVKGRALTASDYGRNWLAWMVFISTLTSLPRFFLHLDGESFIRWLIAVLFFGALAFVLGWVYGMFLNNKQKTTGYSVFRGANLEPLRPFTKVSGLLKKIHSIKLDFKQDDLTDDEYSLYEIALKEIDNNTPKKGVWAKSIVQSKGDNEKAKAEYISIRVKQLKDEKEQQKDIEQKTTLIEENNGLANNIDYSSELDSAGLEKRVANSNGQGKSLLKILVFFIFCFIIFFAFFSKSTNKHTGQSYHNSTARDGDVKAKKQALLRDAEQGAEGAQTLLGILYRFGKEGFQQDYRKAVYWSRKAAEQGGRLGQTNLGEMYYNGQGVQQDYQLAVFWYKKAAEKGFALAQYNLGVMYANGLGVKKDIKKSIQLIQQSAKQGDEAAIEALKRLGVNQ